MQFGSLTVRQQVPRTVNCAVQVWGKVCTTCQPHVHGMCSPTLTSIGNARNHRLHTHAPSPVTGGRAPGILVQLATPQSDVPYLAHMD